MSKQVVYEVTQPYHPDGKNLVYAPGVQFPLDAELPEGLAVREVIAEVPDKPATKGKPEPAAPKAAGGKAAAKENVS